MAARGRRLGGSARPVRTEREVLWDLVRTVARWKTELPSESALMTLLDGFEALATRLLNSPTEDFERVLTKERNVFERARRAERKELRDYEGKGDR